MELLSSGLPNSELTTLLLTGLNSTSKAGDIAVPIPAPSDPALPYSGCPQWEALEGKSRHTKARWYWQLGSRIIQGYNNYSSSVPTPVFGNKTQFPLELGTKATQLPRDSEPHKPNTSLKGGHSCFKQVHKEPLSPVSPN